MSMLLYVAIADAVMAGVMIWKHSLIPPQIPLFLSLPWGEAQLADSWMIFILPVFMHFFVYLNSKILGGLFSEDDHFTTILTIFNLVVILLSTFVFVRVLVVIS